jgi:hypothetical protein
LTNVLKNRSRARPNLFERFELWCSTGRNVDGVWVGTFENEARLQRVEQALQLMKQKSPLHYSRVIHNLDRIWVRLLPASPANYLRRLNACQLDERFVEHEEATPELIASVIVHEATHARLEHWGIIYEEAKRYRIEAICLRRELHFVSGLAGCEVMQDSVRRSLEYYGNNCEYFSNSSFRKRFDDGSLEDLRWLGVPNWLVALVAKMARLRRRLTSARAVAAVQSNPVIPGRE